MAKRARGVAMIEQRDPTHILTITVPLNLDANPAAEDWDIQGAMRQALEAILPMLSLGTLGLLCGGIEVALAPPPKPKP